MQEPKDPAFKLFGKTIPMLADGDAPVSSGDVGDSGAAVAREDGLEEETEKVYNWGRGVYGIDCVWIWDWRILEERKWINGSNLVLKFSHFQAW